MLGENIKIIRKKNKLSQEALAQKAGITYSTLIKLETGANDNPTIKTLAKIAKVLNVKVDDLIQ